MEALFERQLSQFREQVQQAKKIAAEKRYDDAIVALRLSLRSIPELVQAEADAARPLIEQWEQERDQAFQQAANIVERAKIAVDACDYAIAEKLLVSIPEPVLTDEMRSLLAEARGKRREVQRLRKQIEDAMRNRKGATLMRDLDALVQLTPNDPKPRQLAEKIRDQLCELAKRKFECQQFEDAWSAISRIREFVANDRSRSLAKSIERACWLQRNLKFATHVDKSLVETATLMVRLAPQDAKLKQIQQEVVIRWQKSQERQPVSLPPWESSGGEDQSVFGVPVDYLDWSQAFSGAENLHADGGAFATRFTVAAGLALQGIGMASLDVRVTGNAKRGLLGQLSRSLGTSAQAAWGLHFGSTSLKVVRLESTGKDRPPAITHSGVFPFADPRAAHAIGFERRDVIRNALVDAQRALSLKNDPLFVSLASVPILARFPKLPKVDKNKIAGCIEREAKHQIPFPLEEVHWASHLFREPSATQNLSLVLLAMKRTEWQTFSELFQSLGFHIAAIQTEPVALRNIYHFWLDQEIAQGRRSENQRKRSVGLLHVGGDTTHLCLTHPNGIWFRHIPSGGTRLTRNLTIDLKLRVDQAEALKAAPVKSSETATIFRSIAQPISEQIAEFKRTVDVAIREDASLLPKTLWLSGGASLQHGFVRAIRKGPESIALGPPPSLRTNLQGVSHDSTSD